ncbi:MAG: hypothetical protein ABS81_03455 [Pseudonocardia sp. SCN 72-86]|nr:MAG: hypothetical protein ABS81_03455 [Pseudonocardia sp. SCN 72-86]
MLGEEGRWIVRRGTRPAIDVVMTTSTIQAQVAGAAAAMPAAMASTPTVTVIARTTAAAAHTIPSTVRSPLAGSRAARMTWWPTLPQLLGDPDRDRAGHRHEQADDQHDGKRCDNADYEHREPDCSD